MSYLPIQRPYSIVTSKQCLLFLGILTHFVLFGIMLSMAHAGDRSEQVAAKVLRAKLANDDREALKALEQINEKEIIIVSGSMDHIEQILAAGRIKYTLISPQNVSQADLHADQIKFESQ